MGRPEQEARRVLREARAEFESLGEAWDSYAVDVELVGTLLFSLGVQRVPDLRVGRREYAAFLNGDARLVAVESNHHEHRQRFSIAHEVGHFVLHYQAGGGSSLFACSSADMEVGGPGLTRSTTEHLRREWEANRFAAELLMPEASVLAMYRVTGGNRIRMARHFRVSVRAMEIRLDQIPLPFPKK